MKNEFVFDGDKNRLKELMRSFSTTEVLKMVSQESRGIFNNKTEIPGAKRDKLLLLNNTTKRTEEFNIIIQSWNLLDLAYYSIVYGNDFRGKRVISRDEFLVLYEAVDTYKQAKEKKLIDSFAEQSQDIFFYVFGFAGEQIKFETLSNVFDNATRDLYIIFESSKKCDEQIDFPGSVKAEVGVNWEDVCGCLLLAYCGSLCADTMEDVEQKFAFKNSDKRSLFRQVISYYTAEYDEIKNNPLGRQKLYAKPFIYTQTRETVFLGPFLTIIAYEHAVLWILRNHFRKRINNKQEFINRFGIYFENYFEELLSESLESNHYCRIQESDRKKRADWKLKLGIYNVLVEQKSSLMCLAVKQQETDIDSYKSFTNKTILESLRQLKTTEDVFDDGKYIKIVLLYEDYIKAEILDSIMVMPECDIENDGFYWLVTIDEMEKLLWAYKNDNQAFNQIIEEKIRREKNNSKNGKSLNSLLEQNGIKNNEYISGERFDYYRNIARDKIKDICV